MKHHLQLLFLKQYKHAHPKTYITGVCTQTYLFYAPSDTHASRHTERVVRAWCKIRGAVNGGRQLGCCFIKVQRKCRSVSCRMQGIGSASFCLLNLKHIPAGIRQPLQPCSAFLMAIHGKYLLNVSHVCSYVDQEPNLSCGQIHFNLSSVLCGGGM